IPARPARPAHLIRRRMPVPWLSIIDTLIGITDIAVRRRPPAREPEQELRLDDRASGPLGGLEARLAGVVVAALKEAFDRDTRRLELERAELEAERERADRALRLELRRQAGDREIGRLRLLAGMAAASWLGTLFLTLLPGRLMGGAVGTRVALGGGWLLLLAAFGLTFIAQSQIAKSLDRDDERIQAGIAGDLALWFLVAGLAFVCLAVLVA